MNDEKIKYFQDYAWKYFNIHAEQRLKTFHFFIILSTVVIGALITLSQKDVSFVYAAALSFLLSFMSFIFWKLDVRNKELIKHAEIALVYLESEFEIEDDSKSFDSIKLFSSERLKTKEKKRFPEVSLLKTHMSFSDCFNCVFFAVGGGSFIVGFIIMITGLFF